MPKLDDATRDAILQEKSNLTNKQLQDKYGVSRSTIQRIKLPDLESRVSEFTAESRAPDTAKQDFADKFVKTLQQEVTVPTTSTAPLALPQPDRQPIIQKILMNADSFPAHYSFITDRTAFVTSLSEKSALQLQDLLTTMERTRAAGNLAAQMKQVFLVGSRAAETLGARLRLKTQGLANALLQQQQELDYIFKELALSYSDTFTKASSPEMRLATLFGMTLLQVDTRNRIREMKPEEKYDDL
jgi:hypothetical protein